MHLLPLWLGPRPAHRNLPSLPSLHSPDRAHTFCSTAHPLSFRTHSLTHGPLPSLTLYLSTVFRLATILRSDPQAPHNHQPKMAIPHSPWKRLHLRAPFSTRSAHLLMSIVLPRSTTAQSVLSACQYLFKGGPLKILSACRNVPVPVYLCIPRCGFIQKYF